MSLLDMSLAGGVFILAVVVIRAVSINHLPKGTFLCLWAVALGRLLIPYALPSSLSVYSLLERLTPAAEPVQVTVARAPVLPVSPMPYVSAAAPSAAGTVEVATTPISWPVVVWLAVALVCAAVFAVSYYRCCREFRSALPVDNAAAKAWLAAHPLRRRVQLRVSDRITTPLTYGVVRPVILLPKSTDWTDGEGLSYALCHELCHIRRFDAVTKLLLAAALCLHWFNPAVWVMYVLANRDLELSCDEAVVRQLGPDRRRAYAAALIRMEERRSGLAPLYNHFSKNVMEERIVAIMKIRKTSLAALILAVTLIVGVTVAFATTAKQPAAQETVPDQIVASLDYQADAICFTLPEDLTQPEKLTIYVSGRAQYEDGFSRSLHFLEGETWEAGKTYTIPYDPSYTDLFLDVSYPGVDGKLIERSVDLLAAGKYGLDNPDKTTTEVQRVTSYVDPYDGKTYYSTDNGQTWQEGDPFTATGYGFDDVEWWTAEEYEAWLTEQKKEFQAMLGERSWNPTEGWYTWDQARIDAAIAGSKQLLQEIKDGKKVSKPMADGDAMIQFSYDPRGIQTMEDNVTLAADEGDNTEATKLLLDSYAPFGLSYDFPSSTGPLTMRWQGKPVHSVFDAKKGVWIANSMRGLYLGPDAIDLQAVYGDDGKLTGVAPVAANEALCWPLPADQVSASNAFGTRTDPISGKATQHGGIDVTASSGTPVYAAHGGEVVSAEFQSKYGNCVVLDRGDGVSTLYAHLSERAVSVGDRVEAGQTIGSVGSSGQATGPHLHFALYQDGVACDPLAYFPQS